MKERKIIDTHCHLLPGIDDGASDMNEALAICSNAAKLGVRKIVCTPHFIFNEDSDNNIKRIKNAFDSLQSLLIRQNIPIQIFLGYEVYCTEKILEIQNLRDYTLNRSGYLLAEFGWNNKPIWLEELLYNLSVYNIRMIIAHPERYLWIKKDKDLLNKLITYGCLFQIDIGSISGMYGRKISSTAIKMLNRGIVFSVASDAHKPEDYDFFYKKALDIIDRKYPEISSELLYDNPLKCISDYSDI